ncbi:hypothetical protein ACGFZP_31900 [Kitasatospora sp. NPDC048239]|uniref:hypothetical protein n=1 Tax=Kitasatospora sp. NPDC048239 TaxID=3364046 RepID=UPI0037159316
MRHTLTDGSEGAWLARTADLIDTWDIPLGPALHSLSMWASRHPRTPGARLGERTGPVPDRPARGRLRPLPAPTGHELDAILGERSCLPWQLGELRTTNLTPAVDGWSLGGRA